MPLPPKAAPHPISSSSPAAALSFPSLPNFDFLFVFCSVYWSYFFPLSPDYLLRFREKERVDRRYGLCNREEVDNKESGDGGF